MQNVFIILGLIISLIGIRATVYIYETFTDFNEGVPKQIAKWVPAVVVIVLSYVSNIPLSEIGWVYYGPQKFAFYVIIGLLLVFGANIFGGILGMHIQNALSIKNSTQPKSESIFVPLFTAITAGVTEETTFRGYIIEVLSRLTGEPLFAGSVSLFSFVFSHRQQSKEWSSIIQLVILSSVLTLLYFWTRSVPVLIVTHTIFDFIILMMVRRNSV